MQSLLHLMHPSQGAAVVIDVQTRDVMAIVGGYSFFESPYNRAVQARRQTGSTFKAFVYAAALNDRKLTPATVLQDQPLTFRQPGGQTWQPQIGRASCRESGATGVGGARVKGED